MNYIRFLFLLYWFALFLKFGPLSSENPPCMPVFGLPFCKGAANKVNTLLVMPLQKCSF